MKPPIDSAYNLRMSGGCGMNVVVRAHTDAGVLVETVGQFGKPNGNVFHVRDSAFAEMTTAP